MRTLNLTAAAFVVLTTSAAFAQQGPPRGPPPEALTACQGLSSGAACAFTHGPRNVTGTCRAGPTGEGLACAPSDMGPGGPSKGHHGPPPEALSACSGKASGVTCSVTFDGRTLTGTCRSGPNGEALACMPEGGHHGPPPEALSACASSTAGASCSVSFEGKALTGTCVAGPDGAALACLPPRP